MIHSGDFVSSRCSVWYTRGSFSDCSSHLKPMRSSRNASPLRWRSFKSIARRKGVIYLWKLCLRATTLPFQLIISYLSMASWTVICTSFPCLILFVQMDFSKCRRIHSQHTQSKWMCTSSFLWSSFLFFAVAHPVWILLQGSAMPSFSFALSFPRPHLPYSCLATFEAIPVPLDPAFSVRNGFEDRYKR